MVQRVSRGKQWLLGFGILVFLLSGCAKQNYFNKSSRLSQYSPNALSVDAKQRVVLTNPIKGDRDPHLVLRFCAEPSPDVFTAIASSLSAGASFTEEDGKKDISAQLAKTFSENAATIERTQTVNALREVMYRNCERYLSGALSKDEFIVQAARDQQLIVQVLAIEQITGVSKAQSTALTTLSKAAAGATAETLAAVVDAKKQLDVARAAADDALRDAVATKKEGPCGDPIDEANAPDGLNADEAKKKNEKCEFATITEKKAKEAEEHYELVKALVTKQGALSSEVQGKLASATVSASEASAEIADKVLEIVRQYQTFNEMGMTCVVKARNLQNADDLPEYCKLLLEQMAGTEYLALAGQQLGILQEMGNSWNDRLVDASKAAQASRDDLIRNAETVRQHFEKEKNKSKLSAGLGISLDKLEALKSALNDASTFSEVYRGLSASERGLLKKAMLPTDPS